MHRVGRALAVLGLCLGLAATSLAAASGPSTATAADPAPAVVAAARTHLGQAYAWGGAGPDAFDCSGLVYYVWRQTGGVRDVPRTAQAQQQWAVPIPLEQVQPGDLAFVGDPVTHVGLVSARLGTTVLIVDAASSRKGVVERPVWTTTSVRYGRVPRPGMPPVAPWTAATGPAALTTAAPPSLPLPSLPALSQALPSSRTAAAAAALALRQVGARDVGDAALVRTLWRAAGGADLPADRASLEAAGTPVPLSDARTGDLVVYPAPYAHVGLYVGSGMMVDSSRSLGRVVRRAVWAAPGLHLVRLPG